MMHSRLADFTVNQSGSLLTLQFSLTGTFAALMSDLSTDRSDGYALGSELTRLTKESFGLPDDADVQINYVDVETAMPSQIRGEKLTLSACAEGFINA